MAEKNDFKIVTKEDGTVVRQYRGGREMIIHNPRTQKAVVTQNGMSPEQLLRKGSAQEQAYEAGLRAFKTDAHIAAAERKMNTVDALTEEQAAMKNEMKGDNSDD